ncbi:MAG: site-2 protease family protein [Saprospiraceae bacterium]|nr:site-2 protease family protein [Saprospiraceae bacterium]
MFSKGTLQIARVAGIPIRLHWSFGLIFVWVGYNGWLEGIATHNILFMEMYVIILFFCVVLHEFGHALMARKYGHQTRDILLTPIGGIARLESISEKPIQEFWIAIAGPAVNIGIALVLGLIILLTGVSNFFQQGYTFPEANATLYNIIPLILISNVILAVFNIVPAFPMDGGRILRALLSMKFTRLKSTWIAARIGQGLSTCFLIYAIYNNQWMLCLVGIFIFFTAGAELKQVQWETILARKRSGDLMMKQYTSFQAFEPMAYPVELLQRGLERNFLIFNGQAILGTLSGADIMECIKKKAIQQPILDFTHSGVLSIDPDTSLKEALHRMQASNHPLLPVMREGILVGIVDENQINKYMEIQIKTNGAGI